MRQLSFLCKVLFQTHSVFIERLCMNHKTKPDLKNFSFWGEMMDVGGVAAVVTVVVVVVAFIGD